MPCASTNLLFPASPVFIPRSSCVSPNSTASAVVFRAPRQQPDTPGHHPSIPFNPHRARVRRNHGGFLQVAVSKARRSSLPAHHSSVDARFRYSTRTSRDLAALAFLSMRWGLRSGTEAMVTIFASVSPEAQRIQNDPLQYASPFCPIHNSRFALRASEFGSDV